MPMVGWLPQGRRWTAEAELKHGRLAMLAALAFAFTELTTKAEHIDFCTLHGACVAMLGISQLFAALRCPSSSTGRSISADRC